MSRRPVASVRWRKPGVAKIELQHGHDPLTGKPRRMYATVHGNDIDVERKIAAMLLEIGEMPSGRAMTYREFYEVLYKPRIEKSKIRIETQRGYFSKIENHVLPRFGDVKIGDIEPYAIEDWRDELLTKMTGLSALHVFRAFSSSMTRAVRWRRLKFNPLRDVDPPDADERDIETLDAAESFGYLKAFTGHELEPLIIMVVATGFRPCELYGLEWGDIDFKNATVKCERGIHQNKDGGVYEEPPKSKRSRRLVSLPAWAVESLRPLRGIGRLVPLTPAQIGYRYRKHVRAKELRYLPLRDLRHTHATLMLEAGVDIVVVSRRLGHSTVAITDKYYLRPRRSADEKAADAFGQLMATVGVKSTVAGNGGTITAVDE